jgi:hypothetical protein
MIARCITIVLCICLTAHTLTPFSDHPEFATFSRLVEHFQEHQEHEHISFLQFLLLHYSPFSHHSSSTEHHSLPFHSPITSLHSTLHSCLAAIAASEALALQGNITQTPLPALSRFYLYLFYAAIFQPPKNCC